MTAKRYIFPAGLLLLLIIAATFRLTGISWGLPQEFHPDEPLVVPRAVGAITDGDWNPHYFLVPSLQTELTSLAYGAVYIGGKITGRFDNPDDFGEWAAWNNTTIYLIGRFISLIFGLLAVTGITMLAREILSRLETHDTGRVIRDIAPLLAGLVIALSPIVTTSSRLINPDIPMLAFYAWALWLLMKGVNNQSGRHIIIGGFLSGLAVSSKYSAAILLVPLIISFFLFRSRADAAPRKPPVIGTLLALLAGFLLGTPYALLDFGTFISHLMVQYSAQHRGHISMEKAGMTLLRWMNDLATKEGIALAMLGVAGAVILFRKNLKAWWMLVPLLVLYLAEISRWTLYSERYLLPAIAILAPLASVAWFAAVSAMRNPRMKLPVAIILIAAVAVPPAVVNARATSRLLLPDTRTIAMEWIEENIPPGTRILWEIGGPRPADLNEKYHREPSYDIITVTPWFSTTARTDDPSVLLLASNPEYIITSSNYRSRYEDPYTREKYPEVAAAWGRYYAMLDKSADVVYEISPGDFPALGKVVGPEITIYKKSPLVLSR